MGKPKKPALKLLPATWREDMWMRASEADWRQSRPQLRGALALLWLTGCRPAEIEQGVHIFLRGDLLVIEVAGAKCVDAGKRERGQPKRHYGFRTDAEANPALMFLRTLAATNTVNGTGRCRIAHNADYLYNSVVALGKSVFPKLRTRVSPYCFRHQVASDLKADPDLLLEDAAKFMGHLSDYSIGKYGHAAHGRKGGGGRVKAIAVQTSRPIKHSPKVDRLARFKIASAKRRSQKPS
ncbi:site-specific integrase [Paraburkholderia sp. SIMBA_055]